MTREEEIKERANDYATEMTHKGLSSECEWVATRDDFVAGAQWTDEHPKNPWISVNDRLPEIIYPRLGDSNFVFVHVVNKYTGAEWIELPAKYNERLHDWQANDFTWISKRSGVVTHWMPIPGLPKNITKKDT